MPDKPKDDLDKFDRSELLALASALMEEGKALPKSDPKRMEYLLGAKTALDVAASKAEPPKKGDSRPVRGNPCEDTGEN